MASDSSEQPQRGKRKQRRGVVVSTAPHKTAVVRVERRSPHPLYGKVLTKRKRYYVHDENNEAQEGDRVTIMECRPYSKKKRWRLLAIERRAHQ